ncbi:MAG: cytochrome c [Blastocatellia bacterium]|nr:cytochrome c [Blastocatellia bacterium]
MKKRWITLAMMIMGGAMFYYALDPAAVSGQGKTLRGEKLYMEYCASCHGTDGKGGGPVAATLKSAMPDLTRIPLDNGKFPALRIRNVIEGEVNVPTHGTKDMPVWGQYFRRTRGESVAKLNSYALMEYIQSIQGK